MSNIYELTDDILELQEMLMYDPENPYVQDTLEALEGELQIKSGAYCRVIKNMEANLEGLKSEIERLSKRKKTVEHSIQRLKEALFNSMKATGKDKIKDDLFTISIRNNAPQLPKDLSIEQVPIQFLEETAPTINKRELLTAIKNGEVKGIVLEINQSLRIS